MNNTEKIAAILFVSDFVSDLKNACHTTGKVTPDTLLSCKLNVIQGITKNDFGELTLCAVASINEFAHRIKMAIPEIPDDGKLPFEIVDQEYFMFLEGITSKDSAVCAKEGAEA